MREREEEKWRRGRQYLQHNKQHYDAPVPNKHRRRHKHRAGNRQQPTQQQQQQHGESNNSKLSWNNKHTHIHPRRHAHTHTTHSTAIESQKKVAHAASSFTVKWQIAASKQGKQRDTEEHSGVSQSSVPCRMWACLLRGRALAYWRTDRLPRVVAVAVVLFLVEWASYALSSPINRPFPLHIHTSSKFPPPALRCLLRASRAS